jgi:hypothetical protein
MRPFAQFPRAASDVPCPAMRQQVLDVLLKTGPVADVVKTALM